MADSGISTSGNLAPLYIIRIAFPWESPESWIVTAAKLRPYTHMLYSNYTFLSPLYPNAHRFVQGVSALRVL